MILGERSKDIKSFKLTKYAIMLAMRQCKASGSTNTDYSFAGPIPHTVPELMTEMGL